MSVRSRVLVTTLIIATAAGCGAPPPPSAATEALESALLTADQIGGGFEQEFRGSVGSSGGSVCPESEFRFDDVGMVRAAFVSAVGSGARIEIEQMMYVLEEDDIGTLMAGLRAAHEACDGFVWTDYGEEKTVNTMMVPDVGDHSLAVAFPPPRYPEIGTYDYGRAIYVASGDVFIEIACWETLEGQPTMPVISDAELSRIARQAVANLSS